MEKTTRQAALARLEPFVGEWSVHPDFAQEDSGDVRARTVFEWILDRQFLVQRTEVDHPDAPDSHGIVALDDDGERLTQHFFDSRGVVRLYAMTFADGVWTLLRDKADFTPLAFAQRFHGEFSDDRDTIDGRWEISHDGGATWELDFGITFRRVG
jgi:hypothetical protein